MTSESTTREGARALSLYAALAAVLSLVSDGWSGKPSPLLHQFLLIPPAMLLGCLLFSLLATSRAPRELRLPAAVIWLVVFEVWSLTLVEVEAHHYRRFGYHISLRTGLCTCALIGSAWACWAVRRSTAALGLLVFVSYAVSVLLPMVSFPLNYLRSDMLPVIGWADQRLLRHLNPYGSMAVGGRIYDFPYLPGVLLAFLPAAALHLDLRVITFAALLLAAFLVVVNARRVSQQPVFLLVGLFLLCPFLQYRHELYLQPHWLSLAIAVLLMHRQRWIVAALSWGVSCAIYQFSWILLPFVLLHAFRRGGGRSVLKEAAAALLGATVVVGPFLAVASRQVAQNTVGQWSHLSHALADPINLSFWLTYLIRPDQLRWVQAGALTTFFATCFFRGRCKTLADTLRCMCWALAIFIPLNVLVDGYFYLTLLWLLLLFLCVEQGWWVSPFLSRHVGSSDRSGLEPILDSVL